MHFKRQTASNTGYAAREREREIWTKRKPKNPKRQGIANCIKSKHRTPFFIKLVRRMILFASPKAKETAFLRLQLRTRPLSRLERSATCGLWMKSHSRLRPRLNRPSREQICTGLDTRIYAPGAVEVGAVGKGGTLGTLWTGLTMRL